MEFDSDFDELLLLHLIRDNTVLKKAKDLKIRAEDMLSSDLAGIRLYSLILEAVLDVDQAPINRNLLSTLVKQKAKDNLVEIPDNLDELFDYFYTDAVNTEYVCSILPEFIRTRRLTKAHDLNKKDPVKLLEELNKVAVDLEQTETQSSTIVTSPFAGLVTAEYKAGILTGFNEIDAKFHGLAKQECGLLLGHSGSGKTATASSIARFGALYGNKVLYISLEEPSVNIIHRWYAAQFDLSYTALHYGLASADSSSKFATKMELESCFSEMDEGTRAALLNLQIVDARAHTPITPDKIFNLIEAEAEKGFIPDVVIIDQLDYVTPNRQLSKGAQPWMEYEKAAFDLDYMSNKLILGEHPFALWVVHQAKGQMKWEFGYDDIAGFKGIVKPFDMALGVGRHDKDHPYVNLFSMKVRHCAHFRQTYYADFEKMKFAVASWSPEQAKNSMSPNSGKKSKKSFADEEIDDSLDEKKVKPPKKHLL